MRLRSAARRASKQRPEQRAAQRGKLAVERGVRACLGRGRAGGQKRLDLPGQLAALAGVLAACHSRAASPRGSPGRSDHPCRAPRRSARRLRCRTGRRADCRSVRRPRCPGRGPRSVGRRRKASASDRRPSGRRRGCRRGDRSTARPGRRLNREVLHRPDLDLLAALSTRHGRERRRVGPRRSSSDQVTPLPHSGCACVTAPSMRNVAVTGLRQPTATRSVGEGCTATLCGFMLPGMRTAGRTSWRATRQFGEAPAVDELVATRS